MLNEILWRVAQRQSLHLDYPSERLGKRLGAGEGDEPLCRMFPYEAPVLQSIKDKAKRSVSATYFKQCLLASGDN